jgi:very-short-patch-repair endonuclease
LARPRRGWPPHDGATPARGGRNRGRLRWRRDILAALGDVAAGCHSVLELLYVRRVERGHRLPTGVRQHRRDRWYDDVRYEEFGVCVELDGRLAHPVDQRFRDHRRDNAATMTGARVLRYGYSDVTRRPCAVALEVVALLAAGGWRGRPRKCAATCPL